MSECLITIKVGSRRLNSCPTISAYLHAVNYSISQQPINLSNQRWMDTGRVHRHPSDGKTVIMNELLLRNAEVVASNLLFNQPIDSQLWKLLRLWYGTESMHHYYGEYSMTTSTTEPKMTSVRSECDIMSKIFKIPILCKLMFKLQQRLAATWVKMSHIM